MENKKSKYDGGNFIVDVIGTYLGGMLFVQHIRNHVKKYPALKPQIISALEKLLQELKSEK